MTNSEGEVDHGGAARNARATRIAALIVIGVCAAALFILFWTVESCGEAVTQSGDVVEVCTGLEVTDPPILAVGVILLVAAGSIFAEVGAFGITLKNQVADAKAAAISATKASTAAVKAAESARTAAEASVETRQRAREAADQARSMADLAEQFAEREASSLIEPRAAQPDLSAEEQTRKLGSQYNEVRRRMSSGTERTKEMTSIVGSMMQATADLTTKQLIDLLHGEDRGLRLAAFASLYSRPDPGLTLQVARVVCEEDKPFGQYWGLRALHRLVESDPTALDLNSRRQLEELLRRIPSGTDRAYELREILSIDA